MGAAGVQSLAITPQSFHLTLVLRQLLLLSGAQRSFLPLSDVNLCSQLPTLCVQLNTANTRLVCYPLVLLMQLLRAVPMVLVHALQFVLRLLHLLLCCRMPTPLPLQHSHMVALQLLTLQVEL